MVILREADNTELRPSTELRKVVDRLTIYREKNLDPRLRRKRDSTELWTLPPAIQFAGSIRSGQKNYGQDGDIILIPVSFI